MSGSDLRILAVREPAAISPWSLSAEERRRYESGEWAPDETPEDDDERGRS